MIDNKNANCSYCNLALFSILSLSKYQNSQKLLIASWWNIVSGFIPNDIAKNSCIEIVDKYDTIKSINILLNSLICIISELIKNYSKSSSVNEILNNSYQVDTIGNLDLLFYIGNMISKGNFEIKENGIYFKITFRYPISEKK